MWELNSALNADTTVAITGRSGPARLQGMRGVGKSLLAEEYALRFAPAYPGGVFWLRAYGNDDTKETLSPEQREAERDGQLRSFATALALETAGLSSKEVGAVLAGKIEERGERCLWVVNDLPSGLSRDELGVWLAPHPLARTLITTRNREHDSLGTTIVTWNESIVLRRGDGTSLEWTPGSGRPAPSSTGVRGARVRSTDHSTPRPGPLSATTLPLGGGLGPHRRQHRVGPRLLTARCSAIRPSELRGRLRNARIEGGIPELAGEGRSGHRTPHPSHCGRSAGRRLYRRWTTGNGKEPSPPGHLGRTGSERRGGTGQMVGEALEASHAVVWIHAKAPHDAYLLASDGSQEGMSGLPVRIAGIVRRGEGL